MLLRAELFRVSQVGLDAATDSVLFFPTGGVSFWSGVDRARGSFGEPKVTPPFLVYTLSDVTSSLLSRRPTPSAHGCCGRAICPTGPSTPSTARSNLSARASKPSQKGRSHT